MNISVYHRVSLFTVDLNGYSHLMDFENSIMQRFGNSFDMAPAYIEFVMCIINEKHDMEGNKIK
jgi:hypothetical protein